jgi:hypothetical protein
MVQEWCAVHRRKDGRSGADSIICWKERFMRMRNANDTHEAKGRAPGFTRVVTGQQPCHNPPMNQNPTHPYTLEVSKLPDGSFEWAIREHGTLLQRSDRRQSSEGRARENGFKAIEGLRHPGRDDRRR